MLEKIYLNLLILCGILCHGIIAKLSDEDIRESSGFLVRKRRVIGHLPSELIPKPIEEINYMVNIREYRRVTCAGVILSHYTIITVALCVTHDVSHYQIVTGTEYEPGSSFHNVTSKIVHYGDIPHHEFDGIALVRIDPPFEFSSRTGNIRLHVGLLSTGTKGTVAGWGCFYPIRHIPFMKRGLRSITLPIMNHGECQTVYRGRFDVSEKYICTYAKDKYCAHTDTGAPLVVNDRLVGLHIWKGENERLKNPDVFIDLQRTDYSTWISENILLM